MADKTLKDSLKNFIKHISIEYIRKLGQAPKKEWIDYFVESCKACKKYYPGIEDCDEASRYILDAYDACKNTKDSQRYANTLLAILEHCGNCKCGTANSLRKKIEEEILK